MHVNFLVLKSSNRSQKNMKSNNTINRTSIVEGIYRWFIKKWYFFSTCQTDTAIKINNKRSQGNLVSWLWTKCVCRNKQQIFFFFFLRNVWILWKQHNYKANYIKAEVASNILLQANWQETARNENTKMQHLKFNPLHKTIVLYKLRPKQQVQGTTGPNIITKQS